MEDKVTIRNLRANNPNDDVTKITPSAFKRYLTVPRYKMLR